MAAPFFHYRGDVGLRRPGVSLVPVAVLDNSGPVVMTCAGFGERKRSGAERAFRAHAANKPMGPPAAGAMVGLILAIDGVVAAFGEIILVSDRRHHRAFSM